MARILILHPQRSARRFLEEHARKHHEVTVVSDVNGAVKFIGRIRPQLVVAGIDGKRKDALELLRLLRQDGKKVPTVVVASAGQGMFEPLAMKLGASAFLEYPVEQAAFDQTVSKVITAHWSARGEQPPISEEELKANITELEAELNLRMQCFAGKNQVYLQSFILGGGRTSKPRIALKCPLRQEYGDPPNVYYEYIRDVCCSNPAACSAYQTFQAKHSA